MEEWFVVEDGPALGPHGAGPGIYELADELLRDLGIGTAVRFTTDEVEVVREYVEAKGFVGREAAGYAWEERTNTFSSSIPKSTTGYTYGLPGIEMRWALVHEKDGQRGFSDLTRRDIHVRLTDDGRSRFVSVWRRVFGSAPLFVRRKTG